MRSYFCFSFHVINLHKRGIHINEFGTNYRRQILKKPKFMAHTLLLDAASESGSGALKCRTAFAFAGIKLEEGKLGANASATTRGE